MIKKVVQEQNGFLLLEAMLAILIVTIALFAIVGMFGQAAMVNRTAGAYAKTGNIAQKYMEIYKQKIEDSTSAVWNRAGSYDSTGKRTVPDTEFDQADKDAYTITVEAQVNPEGTFEADNFVSDNANKLVRLKVTAAYKRDNSNKVELVTYCLREGY
jgi:Tfp pilus assembly protein PilV